MTSMDFREMSIVLEEKIPKVDEIVDAPMDFMEIYKVCQQMEILCDKDDGVGLSAVQVGVPWKLFIVRSDGSNSFVEKGQYGYFVNCEYEPVTDTEQVVSVEGCLSVRSETGQLRFFQVERSKHIMLKGYKLEVKTKKFVAVDCLLGVEDQGVVYQHEIDHQLGNLISNIGKEICIW